VALSLNDLVLQGEKFPFSDVASLAVYHVRLGCLVLIGRLAKNQNLSFCFSLSNRFLFVRRFL